MLIKFFLFIVLSVLHELAYGFQQKHPQLAPNVQVKEFRCRNSGLKASFDPSLISTLPNVEQILHSESIVSELPFMITAFGKEEVNTAFKIATFFPQPFFLLMIFAPKWKVTEKIMKPWWPVIVQALLHFFIVVVSTSLEEDVVASLSQLNQVFNPAGNPFEAMQKMVQNEGFLAEEWPHVLTWDFFVGRWIWIDGLNRGVFTSHSVLFANLIGPPGFLLHVITSVLSGKGLPPTGFVGADSDPKQLPVEDLDEEAPFVMKRADELIREVFEVKSEDDIKTYASRVAAECSSDVVLEDLTVSDSFVGPDAVKKYLEDDVSSSPPGTQIVIERVADGAMSSGFTWYRNVNGVGKGLRGTTFVKLNDQGQISFIMKACEPLFKPGGATVELLKAVTKPTEGIDTEGIEELPVAERRDPTSAADAVDYLWNKVQGGNKEEALRLFSNDILYEDFNFEAPYRGKQEVSNFLNEFDIPGLRFVPELISEGEKNCCFTWTLEIEGISQEGGQAISGVSFYGMGEDGKIDYVRDIPGAAFKPAPLLALAKSLRPGLQTFQPL
mmetsp:Transcript_40555/g.53380  ORF Transcript_40555/g.53380 Transcript_40555/m.53380 type:complete len:555 (+) Transcript_40555:182-1846(+)